MISRTKGLAEPNRSVDVLFLDANVLFSAAYRRDAGVAGLWRVEQVELISSEYTIEEARRNLEGEERQTRLGRLLSQVRMTTAQPNRPLPQAITLPDKDRPVLLAAIGARATHLVTGDVTHFGRYYGQSIEGVLIISPLEYLSQWRLHDVLPTRPPS